MNRGVDVESDLCRYSTVSFDDDDFVNFRFGGRGCTGCRCCSTCCLLLFRRAGLYRSTTTTSSTRSFAREEEEEYAREELLYGSATRKTSHKNPDVKKNIAQKSTL